MSDSPEIPLYDVCEIKVIFLFSESLNGEAFISNI